MYRRNGSHSLSPGLLGPPRSLPLLQSHGCPAPTRFSLRARGQEGMPQEQADAGSVREHRPLGLQEPVCQGTSARASGQQGVHARRDPASDAGAAGLPALFMLLGWGPSSAAP